MPVPNGRVSLLTVEVIVDGNDAIARVSEANLEIVVDNLSALGRVSQHYIEALVSIEPPARVSQLNLEVVIQRSQPARVSMLAVEVVVYGGELECVPVVVEAPGSIAARYYAKLYNQSGVAVAIFDDWLNLEYGTMINGVGYYAMTIHGDDSRRSLFELGGMLEIYRSVPALGLTWYRDFVGLHRKTVRGMDDNGTKYFASIGLHPNDFLMRTQILYKATSAKAAKNDDSETVLKQFVEENCGPSATVVNGRLRNGVLPYFQVATSSGTRS